MDWIKSIAPLLGTALGGPLGGAAAAFISEKLGLESNSVEAVTKALNGNGLTPDQIVKIKSGEVEFKMFLETNKIDIEKLSVQNTQGARDMQGLTKSHIPGVIAVIIVTGFFAILTCMMLGWLKVSDQQSLLILLGALSAGFGAVLNFYFGSSHGSQNKDILLANAPAIGQSK